MVHTENANITIPLRSFFVLLKTCLFGTMLLAACRGGRQILWQKFRYVCTWWTGCALIWPLLNDCAEHIGIILFLCKTQCWQIGASEVRNARNFFRCPRYAVCAQCLLSVHYYYYCYSTYLYCISIFIFIIRAAYSYYVRKICETNGTTLLLLLLFSLFIHLFFGAVFCCCCCCCLRAPSRWMGWTFGMAGKNRVPRQRIEYPTRLQSPKWERKIYERKRTEVMAAFSWMSGKHLMRNIGRKGWVLRYYYYYYHSANVCSGIRDQRSANHA